MLTLGVLASGRGTDFQAIVDHVKLRILVGVRIALLVSNVQDAEVIDRARKEGIESLYVEGISGRKFESTQAKEERRLEFDRKVIESFERDAIDLVILAGFNQILSSSMVERFGNRIMNIHPAHDIERFGGPGMVGIKVHQAVIDAKESVSGCTVHYVDSTVDRGPVIIRASVPVLGNDDPASLQRRVLALEHRTYPKAIQLHADGRVRMENRRVFLDLYSDNWELEWMKRQQRYILQQEGSMGK